MKRIAIVEDNRNFAEEVSKEVSSSRWECPIEIDVYEDSVAFLDNPESVSLALNYFHNAT